MPHTAPPGPIRRRPALLPCRLHRPRPQRSAGPTTRRYLFPGATPSIRRPSAAKLLVRCRDTAASTRGHRRPRVGHRRRRSALLRFHLPDRSRTCPDPALVPAAVGHRPSRFSTVTPPSHYSGSPRRQAEPFPDCRPRSSPEDPAPRRPTRRRCGRPPARPRHRRPAGRRPLFALRAPARLTGAEPRRANAPSRVRRGHAGMLPSPFLSSPSSARNVPLLLDSLSTPSCSLPSSSHATCGTSAGPSVPWPAGRHGPRGKITAARPAPRAWVAVPAGSAPLVWPPRPVRRGAGGPWPPDSRAAADRGW